MSAADADRPGIGESDGGDSLGRGSGDDASERVLLFGDGGDPDDPFRRPPDPGPATAAPSTADEFDDLDLDQLLADDVIVDDGSAHDDFLLDDFDDDFDDAAPWSPVPPDPSAWLDSAAADASAVPGAEIPAAEPVKPRRHLVIDDFDGMDEPGPGRGPGAGIGASVSGNLGEGRSPVANSGVPNAMAPSAPSAPGTRVIIDGTDDLPDAIVLSDTRREGGNLLIGDDDDLSALVLPDEKPKMNQKVRQRRITVRRSIGRKRLKWILGIGVPVLAIVVALAVLASPLFSVKTVTVDGAVHTSADQLEAILGPLRNKPVLTIDTQQVERQLGTLPWVRRVAVDAQFPSSLEVSLIERVPAAAYVGTDLSWRIIDIDGGVIDMVPGGAQPSDFLAIFGPGPDLQPGQNAGTAYQTLAQLAATLDGLPTLRPLIASISVVGPDINLNLTTTATVNLGTASDLRQKLAVLLTLLSDPEREIDKVVSINVSDPTKPAIAPG